MQRRRQQHVAARVLCQAYSNGKHTPKPRRVVVTGMGVVSTLGHDADEFYDNLLQVLLREQRCQIPAAKPPQKFVWPLL